MTDLQHELHQLKAQVAEMNRRFSLNPDVSSPSMSKLRDTYARQFDDVAAHAAASMEDLKAYQDRLRYPPDAYHHGWATSPQTQHYMALPSGPSFWRLFRSLQTDVRGVEGRVTGLERTVSDLEDRVDRQDSDHFTPLSSVAGADETFAFHSDDANDGCTDDRFGSLSTRESTENVYGDYPTLAREVIRAIECNDFAGLRASSSEGMDIAELAASLEDTRKLMLREGTYRPGSGSINLEMSSETPAGHQMKLDASTSKLTRLEEDLERHHARIQRQKEHIERRQAKMHEDASSHSDELSQVPRNVVFRDQEIVRMDALLTSTQDSLAASEQRAAEKDRTVDSMLANQSELEGRIAELESTEAAHRIDMTTLSGSLENATAELQTRSEQLERSTRRVDSQDQYIARMDERDEAYRLLTDDHQALLRSNRQHVQHLEDTIRQYQRNKGSERDDEMEELQMELRRLNEFCERKDVVLREQQQLVASGARLLEERDGAIDSLRRKLDDERDSVTYALRQQTILSEEQQDRHEVKLQELKDRVAHACHGALAFDTPELHGTDKQLARLKQRLSACAEAVDAPKPGNVDVYSVVQPNGQKETYYTDDKGKAVRYADASPFVRHQVYQAQPNTTTSPWTPRRQGYRQRLPHEANRASAWNDGERQRERPVFGRTSSMGSAVELKKAPASVRVVKPEVPWYEIELPWRVEKQSSTNKRREEGSPPPRHSYRHSTVNPVFQPPLPARQAAHKVSSMANLRSQESEKRERGIAKHRSMQELPRRHLQAYVETENEN